MICLVNVPIAQVIGLEIHILELIERPDDAFLRANKTGQLAVADLNAVIIENRFITPNQGQSQRLNARVDDPGHARKVLEWMNPIPDDHFSRLFPLELLLSIANTGANAHVLVGATGI